MSLISTASKLREFLGEKRFSAAKALVLAAVRRTPLLAQALKKKLVEIRAKDRQIQLAVNLMSIGDNEPKAFLNSLATDELVDADSVFTAMLRRYLNKGLDPRKKTVAIYLVGPGYLENLGNIPFSLCERGYNVLALVGSSPSKVAELYHEARQKTKIEACLCVGLIEGMPEDTKIIYFVHDIFDSPLTEMDKVHRLLPKCSFIVVPNEPALDRYKEKVVEGRKKVYKQGNVLDVCFIRAGYPKLDSNMRYFHSYSGGPRAIIYATTILHELEDLVSLPEHGSRIIECLLSGIPDRILIFRPHPGTLESPEVNAIVKTFSRHPRFIFDNNASFYMGNYSKSALMISDLSGTAFTYSFTTLRPVIFFSHNEDSVRNRFGCYKYFNDRNKIGYIVQDEKALLEKVREMLQDNGAFSNRIKQYRDSLMYNVGSSERYIVDNFEYILEDKKHPDWIYV